MGVEARGAEGEGCDCGPGHWDSPDGQPWGQGRQHSHGGWALGRLVAEEVALAWLRLGAGRDAKRSTGGLVGGRWGDGTEPRALVMDGGR